MRGRAVGGRLAPFGMQKASRECSWRGVRMTYFGQVGEHKWTIWGLFVSAYGLWQVETSYSVPYAEGWYWHYKWLEVWKWELCIKEPRFFLVVDIELPIYSIDVLQAILYRTEIQFLHHEADICRFQPSACRFGIASLWRHLGPTANQSFSHHRSAAIQHNTPWLHYSPQCQKPFYAWLVIWWLHRLAG